jgi:hypothetical protein
LSNLVFLTGGFSSGSTLLVTLFRKSGEFYTLYEPLHERLLEHLYGGMHVYEHHYFVEDYYAEYRGFTAIPRLFDSGFGTTRLSLKAGDEAPELYRYLSYLIGTGFARSPKVLLKENRFPFRLGWLKAKFPEARVIHIHRDCDAQWKSTVRRAQAFFGREDVGQDSVTFNGMNTAGWCDDLSVRYPELAADRSKTGYERFRKLWELELAENRTYADVSVSFEELTRDFETVCGRIWAAVPCASDYRALKQWVVPPDQQETLQVRPHGLKSRLIMAVGRARFRYARLRLALARLRRQ